MRALEQAMEINDRLEDVVVLEDSAEPFELSTSVQGKLHLNQSGLPRLLNRKTCNSLKFQKAFVNSIIANRDNTDAVCYALCQEPTLLSPI
jgi:hypothetical protein